MQDFKIAIAVGPISSVADQAKAVCFYGQRRVIPYSPFVIQGVCGSLRTFTVGAVGYFEISISKVKIAVDR